MLTRDASGHCLAHTELSVHYCTEPVLQTRKLVITHEPYASHMTLHQNYGNSIKIIMDSGSGTGICICIYVYTDIYVYTTYRYIDTDIPILVHVLRTVQVLVASMLRAVHVDGYSFRFINL